MKWRISNRAYVAISDCNTYEIRRSHEKTRGYFYNAWHVPTDKHVAASHDKAEILERVKAHADRISPPSTSARLEKSSAECCGDTAGGVL